MVGGEDYISLFLFSALSDFIGILFLLIRTWILTWEPLDRQEEEMGFCE